MINLWKLFTRQIQREIFLQKRQIRYLVNACLFFLMSIIFFPLTMRPEITLLREIIPGLVWIAILFTILLSVDRIYQQDYEDGVIEQWLISGYPVSLLLSAKIFIHWLVILLPIIIFCPLLALIFHLSYYEASVLILSLVCGTPAMLYLGALAAAFSAGIQQKGVLMALILLPLTLPVMIFGSGTLSAAMQGLAVQGYLAILLAISILVMGFLPVAIGAVMRLSMVE